MKRNENGFRGYSYHDLDDIDCIEIDPNLQAMLIGKGFRVVHDDFLSYYTRKRYDLILMNPPFADGDAHLLKALELCENGGQIACILNAETIRNPYTNSRKALIKELRRRGASIRYLSNAFAHAARRARVDVALININIPKSLQDDTLWEGLKKAREERFEYFGMQEVAPANQVERLIREYDILCEAGIIRRNSSRFNSSRELWKVHRIRSRSSIELRCGRTSMLILSNKTDHYDLLIETLNNAEYAF